MDGVNELMTRLTRRRLGHDGVIASVKTAVARQAEGDTPLMLKLALWKMSADSVDKGEYERKGDPIHAAAKQVSVDGNVVEVRSAGSLTPTMGFEIVATPQALSAFLEKGGLPEETRSWRVTSVFEHAEDYMHTTYYRPESFYKPDGSAVASL